MTHPAGATDPIRTGSARGGRHARPTKSPGTGREPTVVRRGSNLECPDVETPFRSVTGNASSPLREAPGSARRWLAGLLALTHSRFGFRSRRITRQSRRCDGAAMLRPHDRVRPRLRSGTHGPAPVTRAWPQAYFDHVETRLPGYSINTYELGTQDYGGYRYRAVGISAILDLYRSNIIRIIVVLDQADLPPRCEQSAFRQRHRPCLESTVWGRWNTGTPSSRASASSPHTSRTEERSVLTRHSWWVDSRRAPKS